MLLRLSRHLQPSATHLKLLCSCRPTQVVGSSESAVTAADLLPRTARLVLSTKPGCSGLGGGASEHQERFHGLCRWLGSHAPLGGHRQTLLTGLGHQPSSWQSVWTLAPKHSPTSVGRQLARPTSFSESLRRRGFAAKGRSSRGGKMKQYSSYKGRFKMNVDAATGETVIRYMRPGHRHKRFVKTSKQNRELRKSKALHVTYAKTMKRLGFERASF